MFSIDSIHGNQNLLITNDSTIILYSNLANAENATNELIFTHSAQLTSSIYLKKNNYVAFTDLNKKFYIIDLNNQNKILTVKDIAKRAAKMISNNDESILFLGDKTGDVYTFDLNSYESAEFKMLLGHLSMLTDMVFTSTEKFFITSDRDEKIRVSCYPNSYNIEAYLMAHKEFVIQIQLIDDENLLSASGDHQLIVWDLNSYRVKQIIEMSEVIDEKELEQNEDVHLKLAINRFDYNHKDQVLVVHLFGKNFLLLFNYCRTENKFKFVSKQYYDRQIDSFVRVLDNYYVSVSLDSNIGCNFYVKKLVNSELVEIQAGKEKLDNKFKSIESYLNKNVQIKPELREELKAVYLSYFKSKVDNISDYYDRKQERMNKAATKRKNSDSQEAEITSELKQTK